MTALACLRILNDPEDLIGRVETPTLAVRRIVAAWLVSRWAPPRRFGEVVPGGFVLTDEDGDHVGAAPLIALARELGHCGVTLALLSGEQSDVTRFAALHAVDLRAVLAGQMIVDGMNGEVSVIGADGVRRLEPSETITPTRLVMDDAALAGATATRVAA